MPAAQQALVFKSPAAQRQFEIEDAIKARTIDGTYVGGIVAEEVQDQNSGKITTLLHIGNPYEDRPQVITLPTRCSTQDIEEIRSRIIPMRESYKILAHLALSWRMNHPLYIEGETSIGKTFIVDKFTELVYGRAITPIDIYCVEETEASELLGKWVPHTASQEDRQRLRDYLRNPFGANRLVQIQAELNSAKDLPPDQLEELAQDRLARLAEDVGLTHKAQWQYTKGALLQAMTGSVDEQGRIIMKEQAGEGDGLLLHVQEIGLARPGIATTFLQLGGTHGETRDELQLFQNGGHRIHAGSMFRVVFTNNPPKGKYLKRNPIDPALERRCDVLRLGDLSEESYRLSASRFFSFQAGNAPSYRPADQVFLDLAKQPEIAKEVSSIAAAFHMEYKDRVEQNLAGGRTQEISVTLDYMAKLAQFAATCQLCSKDTGRLDLAETLRRGVEMFYIGRLPPQDAKQLQRDQESLKDQVRQQFESLLTGKETGGKLFRGVQRTRKEILDILVKEALIAVESGGDQKLIAERFKQLPVEEMRQHNDLLIGRLLRSPHLPRPYKQRLKGPQASAAAAPGESQGSNAVLDPAGYRDRRIGFFLECLEGVRQGAATNESLTRERDLLSKISRLADPTTFFGLRDGTTKEVLVMPENAYLLRPFRSEGEVRTTAFTPDAKKFMAGLVMPGPTPIDGVGKMAILGFESKNGEDKAEVLFMGSTPEGTLPEKISADCSKLVVSREGTLQIVSMSEILVSEKTSQKLLEVQLRKMTESIFEFSPDSQKFAITGIFPGQSELSEEEFHLRVYPLKRGFFRRADMLQVALHNEIISLSFSPDSSALFMAEKRVEPVPIASKKGVKSLFVEEASEPGASTHAYILRKPGATVHFVSATALPGTLFTLEEDVSGDFYLAFYPLMGLGKNPTVDEIARFRIPGPVDPQRIELHGDRLLLKQPVPNSQDVTEMLGSTLAQYSVYRLEADFKPKLEYAFITPDNPPHRQFGPLAIAPGSQRVSVAVNRWDEQSQRGDSMIGIFDY